MDDKQRAYYMSKMRKVLIFRYLEDEALIRILQISNIISYKKNDYIISEGETSPYLFAVLEGSINVSVKKEEGKEIFICTTPRLKKANSPLAVLCYVCLWALHRFC